MSLKGALSLTNPGRRVGASHGHHMRFHGYPEESSSNHGYPSQNIRAITDIRVHQRKKSWSILSIEQTLLFCLRRDSVDIFMDIRIRNQG